MRSFRAWMMLVGLAVAAAALVVAPGAALGQELPYPRGGPAEGPGWWTGCEDAMGVFHASCNQDPAVLGIWRGAEIEVTSLEGAAATFVARFKPIATTPYVNAPVTYWRINLNGPSNAQCGRYPWCLGGERKPRASSRGTGLPCHDRGRQDRRRRIPKNT